jgi:hypothetical protein
VTATSIDFIVEEPSMEAFLRVVLPMILGRTQFKIRPFQSKDQLLKHLPIRLQGYAQWIPANHKIIVLVDRDNEDCERLKAQLEQIALNVGLATRSQPAGGQFTVINRIVIEELEAWYFGDWQAVQNAYPRVSPAIPRQQRYRDPDAIQGGTWEHFERILQRAGYYKNRLRKIEAAQSIGPFLDPENNRSHSFQCFRDALRELVGHT